MSREKILLLGGSGMLGSDIQKVFLDVFEVVAPSHLSCDITSFESVLQTIAFHEPDVVLNASAYTDVEGAEYIGLYENSMVNAWGPYNLAKACSAFGVDCIHISTDYVFDGKVAEGYFPHDAKHPINHYGVAKSLGEDLFLQEYSDTIIVRASSLYGGTVGHTHFVGKMQALMGQKTEIQVIQDRYTFPTYTMDFAASLVHLIQDCSSYRGDILHMTNASQYPVSWFDFAREIQNILGSTVELIACTASVYPERAKRPKYSLLRNDSVFLLPDWKEALARYFSIQR